jgi:hypothetical protein
LLAKTLTGIETEATQRVKWLVARVESCRHTRKADIFDHRCVISILLDYVSYLFLFLFLSSCPKLPIQSIQLNLYQLTNNTSNRNHEILRYLRSGFCHRRHGRQLHSRSLRSSVKWCRLLQRRVRLRYRMF